MVVNCNLDNDIKVLIRNFTYSDSEDLFVYYNSLTAISKRRFAPHRFDREGIGMTFSSATDLCGYIAINSKDGLIVGYAVCKLGFFSYDKVRFENYGYNLNEFTDCFYAPSVLDNWHGKGLGKDMFHFILEHLRLRGIKRIFLWGGVQISNNAALGFYNGLGFVGLGEYEGTNRDMVYIV